MDLHLSPDQPDTVAAAIELLVAQPPQAPDPWWQAGLEEALET